MQINLFKCTAERNRVNKSDYISDRLTLSGTLKDHTSIMNLTIRIQHVNPAIYFYNYMYIADFKRYYFIDDIVNLANNIWEIRASVDVLYSFMVDINQSRAIIEKVENEDGANLYLDDGSFVMDTRKYNEVKVFPNGLNNNGTYILICAGGV